MYICFSFLRRRIVSVHSRSFPLPHLRSHKELFEGVGISFIGGSDKNRFFGRKLSWVSYFFQALERRRTTIMGEGEECIELKFRIYDGTDIGHTNYASSTTVATLKQKLVAEWPQDKTITPKSMNDVKLIHAGKVLEDNKTLADSRIIIGDLPGGVTTMHVVVQPPVTKKKTDKNEEHIGKMNSCSCTII